MISDALKKSVIEIIYSEAARTGKSVFCILVDTISSKTKPSSQALHPIENAYFFQSDLNEKQDYGHQAVAVMLSCNCIVLNYAFVLYDKSILKIDIVQNIAGELPVSPVKSYFLCDSWSVSEKIINTFVVNGFYAISALKTNWMLYPFMKEKSMALKTLWCSLVIPKKHLVIWRYWLIMSLAYYICIAGTGRFCSFIDNNLEILFCCIYLCYKYRC